MLLEEPQTSAPWGGLEEAGAEGRPVREVIAGGWERGFEDVTSGDWRLQPGEHLHGLAAGMSQDLS